MSYQPFVGKYSKTQIPYTDTDLSGKTDESEKT
jgi:hypothetical protein